MNIIVNWSPTIIENYTYVFLFQASEQECWPKLNRLQYKTGKILIIISNHLIKEQVNKTGLIRELQIHMAGFLSM